MSRLPVDDLGLDEKDLRVIFDAGQRSIEKWMSGETLPQKQTRRRLNELAALHAHLGETFTSMRARACGCTRRSGTWPA